MFSQDIVAKVFTLYPTCRKCGKNHLKEFLYGKEGCYGYGQVGHKLKDYISNRQGNKGGRAQLTSSLVPVGRIIQKGSTSSTSSSKIQNHFYKLLSY